MRPVQKSAAGWSPVRRLSAAVGALCAGAACHAQVSVSADGQPGFSYPIAVPPGIAGVQPSLSLVYSGGGNGPLGVGWVLSGTSVIARCPATKDVDGVVRGVNYASSDKLCLDGQRLIQTDAVEALLRYRALRGRRGRRNQKLHTASDPSRVRASPLAVISSFHATPPTRPA